METQFVGWKVSLSNGETFYEQKGMFTRDAIRASGRRISPWRALKEYISENDLKITSLSLYTKDGQNFHLPSAGRNPQQKEFRLYGKPDHYDFFRAIKSGGMNSSHTVIMAIYRTHRLQIWVDNNNSKNCWCVAIPESVM